MRLIVQVLPLAAGPSKSLVARGRVPSLPQKPDKFTIPVNPDHTFEQIWGLVETRYKRNYLTDAQAATFTIKKIQDAYNCDLDLGDTVGAIFEGEKDQEKIMIQVIQAAIDRDISILPTSNLRPQSAHKRLLDFQNSSSNKRRRIEEQRYGTPLENLHPDTPVQTSEGDTQTERLGKSNNHNHRHRHRPAGGRRSRSVSSNFVVQDSQVDFASHGNHIAEKPSKSQSPQPDALSQQSVPGSIMEHLASSSPRTNGIETGTPQSRFLKPSLPASLLRGNPPRSGQQAPLKRKAGGSTLMDDEIEDLDAMDGGEDAMQEMEFGSQEHHDDSQHQHAGQLPSNPYGSHASTPEVVERAPLLVSNRRRLDSVGVYDRIVSPDEERLFGGIHKRVTTYGHASRTPRAISKQTPKPKPQSTALRSNNSTKPLTEFSMQREDQTAEAPEAQSPQTSRTGPSLSMSNLVSAVKEKQRRRSTDSSQNSPEIQRRTPIAEYSVESPLSVTSGQTTPGKVSTLKKPSKTSYNLMTPHGKKPGAGKTSTTRKRKDMSEKSKAKLKEKEEAGKKINDGKRKREEDAERSLSRDDSVRASQDGDNRSRATPSSARFINNRVMEPKRKSCDTCHARKEECDGKEPCSYCVKNGLGPCLNSSALSFTLSQALSRSVTPITPVPNRQTTIPFPRDKGKGKLADSSPNLARDATNELSNAVRASSSAVTKSKKMSQPQDKSFVAKSSPLASRRESEQLAIETSESLNRVNRHNNKAGPSKTMGSTKDLRDYLNEREASQSDNQSPNPTASTATPASTQEVIPQFLGEPEEGSPVINPAKVNESAPSGSVSSFQSSTRRSVSFQTDIEISEKPTLPTPKPASALGILKNASVKGRTLTTPARRLVNGMSSQKQPPGTTPSRASKADKNVAPSLSGLSRTPSQEPSAMRRKLLHVAIPAVSIPDVKAQQERILARQQSASLDAETRPAQATLSDEATVAPTTNKETMEDMPTHTGPTPAPKSTFVETKAASQNESSQGIESEKSKSRSPELARGGILLPFSGQVIKPITRLRITPTPSPKLLYFARLLQPSRNAQDLVQSHANPNTVTPKPRGRPPKKKPSPPPQVAAQQPNNFSPVRKQSSEDRQIANEIEAAETRKSSELAEPKVPETTKPITVLMSDEPFSDVMDVVEQTEPEEPQETAKADDISNRETAEPEPFQATPPTAIEMNYESEIDALDDVKTPVQTPPVVTGKVNPTTAGAQESNKSDSESESESSSDPESEEEEETTRPVAAKPMTDGAEDSSDVEEEKGPTKPGQASSQPARKPAQFVSQTSSEVSSSDADDESDEESSDDEELAVISNAEVPAAADEDTEMKDADSVPPSSPPEIPTQPREPSKSSSPSSSASSSEDESSDESTPVPTRPWSTKKSNQASSSSQELGSPPQDLKRPALLSTSKVPLPPPKTLPPELKKGSATTPKPPLPPQRSTQPSSRAPVPAPTPIPRPPNRTRVSAQSFPSITEQLSRVRSTPKPEPKPFNLATSSLKRIKKSGGKAESGDESSSEESSSSSSSESSGSEDGKSPPPKPGLFRMLGLLNR